MDKSSCPEFSDNCAKHIRKAERLQALDGKGFDGGLDECSHSPSSTTAILLASIRTIIS